MNIKNIKFTPDATLKAIEAGHSIEDIVMVCEIKKCPGREQILVHYGLPGEAWDVLINILRVHGGYYGQAMAEGMLNALEAHIQT